MPCSTPLPCALQAFLQEKDADQVLRGGRFGQLGDRTGLELQTLLDAGAAAFPHIDQRKRCGVVLLAHLRRGLLDDHGREDLTRHPVVGCPGLGAQGKRANVRATQQRTGFGQQLGGRREAVDHAQRQCALGRQRLAGEHHRQCVGGADKARQAGCAAPARMDTQHHFGQADASFVVIGGDALAAGQNQLGAAAHAGAMNGSHRGTGQAGQRFIHTLAVLDVFQHRALLGVGDEFLDIGTDSEAERLGRMDQHASRLFDGQSLDDLAELVQHFARNGVDTAAGAVKGQGDNAAVIQARLPVIEAQSFEHGHTRVTGKSRTIPARSEDCETAPGAAMQS